MGWPWPSGTQGDKHLSCSRLLIHPSVTAEQQPPWPVARTHTSLVPTAAAKAAAAAALVAFAARYAVCCCWGAARRDIVAGPLAVVVELGL